MMTGWLVSRCDDDGHEHIMNDNSISIWGNDGIAYICYG